MDLIILWGRTSMDETTPHMHTQNYSSIYDEKKNKFRHSAKDMFNQKSGSKSFHLDLSERMEKELGFDVESRKQTEDERLPNKSIKLKHLRTKSY